jgi:hypothetical protein
MGFRCNPCNLDFPSAHQLRQHRVGHRHHRRAVRLFWRDEKKRLAGFNSL